MDYEFTCFAADASGSGGISVASHGKETGESPIIQMKQPRDIPGITCQSRVMKTNGLKLLLKFVLLPALCVSVSAQAPSPAPAPANPPGVVDQAASNSFWDCTLPGGNYTVALSKISVVSLHEFNLPGGRVTEMNIVTDGAGLARFYFMEPALPLSGTAAASAAQTRLTDLVNTAADRTGTDKIWQKVQKDYPLATHAHTIEFRIQNKADLIQLHTSAKRAWMTGAGRTVTSGS